MDERGFIDALVAKDPAAWRRFVQEYGPVICRAACALLARRGPGDARQDAEDIAQKVLTLLLQDGGALLRTFQSRSRLSTWLIGIARQQALMHLRAERRKVPWSSLEEPAGSDPLEELVAAEDRKHLAAALERIGPRDQLLLRMHSEGVSHAEIAQAMSLSPNSISPLLERARERLTKALAGPEKTS